MNKTIILSLVFGFGLLMASPVSASYGSEECQPIYGGGQTCATTEKVALDKKVLNPVSNTKGNTEVFVDNLSINDPKYFTGQTVKFQITVTNTSETTISEVEVSDVLPAYLNDVKGPGTYDNSSKTLKFNIVNLNPNESRKYIISANVAEISALPTGQEVVCVVNQAIATVNNNESRDNSQFCITKSTPTTKGGLPVMDAPKGMTKTPATGPEMLPLLGLIPAGIGGLFLRRRASK